MLSIALCDCTASAVVMVLLLSTALYCIVLSAAGIVSRYSQDKRH